MPYRIFASLPLCVLASVLSAQSVPSASIDSVFSRSEATGSPGCALGVVRNGALAYAKGYGLASVELSVPITPATVFDIGSVSKQFSRHLLHHTSGLRDYLDVLSWSGVAEEAVTGDRDALEAIARQRAPNFAAGAEYRYSNSGFFLLSIITGTS